MVHCRSLRFQLPRQETTRDLDDWRGGGEYKNPWEASKAILWVSRWTDNEKEAVFEDGPREARMQLLLEVIVLQRDVVSLCSGAGEAKVQISKRC